MNTKIGFLSFALLLATLMYSCSTPYKYISIETLELANVSIPGTTSRLLIIDNTHGIDSNMLVNYVNNSIDSSKLNNNLVITMEAIIAVIQTLEESNHFSYYKPYKSDSMLLSGKEINYPYLQELCNQNNTDIVLFTDQVQHTFESTGYFYEYTDESDFLVREKYFGIRYSIHINWLLVDPYGSELIDYYSYFYKNLWQLGKSTKSSTSNYLHDSLDLFKSIGFNAGITYGERIAPHWQSDTRLLFYKGNEDLKNAFHKANKNNWSEAMEIWNTLAKNKNPDIAARAAYNLAVGYELTGSLWRARMWALRSFRINSSKLAADYANLLYERIQYYQKIEENQRR